MDILDESINDLQSLKQTAEMLEKVGNNVLNFFQSLDNKIAEKKAMHEKIDNISQNFDLPESTLTGDLTDLATCENGLDKSVLDTLPADKKEELIKNLERAENQGLISVDFDKNKITLTDKGREFIKNPNFQRELSSEKVNLLETGKTEPFGMELTGTDRDLLFFKEHSIMDLKEINFGTADTELTDKFAKNVKNWADNGLVKLSKNSDSLKIAISEKGKNLLADPAFLEKIGGEKLAETALSTLPQTKLAIVIKNVVMAVADTAKTASKASVVSSAMGGA
jgi:predicted transcriptional regulator